MDYQLENLGPENFQEFCQALLARQFPKLQCFPVAQRDGGRDALAYYLEGKSDEFILFKVKYVRRPQAEQEPRKWLLGIMEEETEKAKKLIPRGAKEYYLLTNVPGTAYPESGSIDRAHALIHPLTGIPSQCWWREDIVARLDNAWDIKWVYPELMTGRDMLRCLIEAGLSEDKERRTSAVRAFVRDQYELEATVRFKQIELQNRLLDLFIDVPVIAREPQGDRRKRSRSFQVIAGVARETVETESSGEFAVSELSDQTVYPRSHRRDDGLGAATMLLHRNVQQHVTRIVLEGAPGQGKSTITQYVCQIHRMRILNEGSCLAEVAENHKNGPLRLPIRVDLRDLATWFNKQNPFSADESNTAPEHWQKSLESFLASLIRHHAGGIDFGINDLHAVGKTSALLLVLDGLDEVADIQRRKEVVDEVVRGVNRLAESACSIQVIVTSRPAAFANSPGMPYSTFQYCELGSLTPLLINAYAKRWLKARKLQGREAGEVNRILKEKLDQPHLRDLARNPMQLAILLSLIHTRGASLPDKRTALYDSYVELFFSREAEKSTSVREHRELLIDIHRYLAWVLHSESEQGRSRGSLTEEELHKRVSDYLAHEGYDTSLAEVLFKGMIERVVALVSRVEGTYEFEVQPLREYFAARYLYETANYSPPGAERRGTLPDRLDAIAKNFFWLNVTRFYAGCFSKGELPSLVDRLEELIRAPGYKTISHPRVLAATLLSDWVFAQHPKSMRKVVSLILDSLGLRQFVAEGFQGRRINTPLVLPKQCGNEELVEQCFTLLRSMPPRDFSLSLIELLVANTTINERMTPWRKQVEAVTGDERTQWLENGLHLQVLPELAADEFDRLFSDEPLSRRRINVVFRLPHLARWEQDESRFSEITDEILSGTVTVRLSRTPHQLLHFLAHSQDSWRFGIAMRNRHPIPLAAVWNDFQHGPSVSLKVKDISNVPKHAPAQKCLQLIETVSQCAEASAQDWASSLEMWDRMVERSRELFGNRWTQCRIACVAGGIRSTSEQCNDFCELLDNSTSMVRRVRYARLRAGQPAWWEKQLQNVKTEFDASFTLLILLTWGSANCLTSLAPLIGTALAGLSSACWRHLWGSFRECVDISRIESAEGQFRIGLDELPASTSERLIVAFGERADPDVAVALYQAHLSRYSGSDYPVLHFAQREAVRLLLTSSENNAVHLAMLERSYSRGVMMEHFPFRVRLGEQSSPTLAPDVAEQITSHSDRFPMEMVSLAEALCKERLAGNITPVGTIAQQDHWFSD